MRFKPGKVYESIGTSTRVLCLADEEWMLPIRRRMYYILLRGFGGDTPTKFPVEKWDYTPEDADKYYRVEE
jgi:hypothetical protein